MTVKELRERLEAYVETLDQFDDELEIPMRCSTYGLSGQILEIPYNGFIELDSLEGILEEVEASWEYDED
ncbi:MAG: hypothetical protein UIG52_06670 [Bacteroidales bacterium]|nr:hypothetical protein [Bacteroidales bacterium]